MATEKDKKENNNRNVGEMLLYQSEDGTTKVYFKEYQGTVWLTQAQISELFQKARNTITEHIQNIFTEGELQLNAVCREFRHTAMDGKSYSTQHYNLDLILAVGYRVRSARGIQFRQWATTTLKEYLVKGFVLNDERLKNPGGWDYFDVLLERIRDIRASRRHTMTMKQWEERLDAFLTFNDRAVLTHAGNISHEKAEQIVSERFDVFDEQRRNVEADVAEEEYFQELEALGKEVVQS